MHPTALPPKKNLGFLINWFRVGFMIKIESGVEIPQPEAPLRKMKYPFNCLSAGDSFVFPVEEGEDRDVVQNRLRSAAANWGRDHGVKFVTRRVQNGIRVWRVK